MAKKKDIKKEFYIIDAKNQVLGRLSTKIAHLLRGKHKPSYTPHLDTGDFVIVINAAKIKLTGNKLEQKVSYRHSGYPGGLKKESYKKIIAEKPEVAVYKAVKGMLPHTRLGRVQLKKLKVYSGSEHPHHSQKLKELII